METDKPIVSVSPEAIESAEKRYNTIQAAFPEAIRIFEARWATAQTAFKHGASIDTSDEFEDLRRLGQKIIPMIVFKIATDADQSPIGVSLYKSLERNPEYRVSDPDVSQQDARRCSSRIIELNYHRNRLFDERASAWKDQNKRNHRSSATASLTLCEEYDDLVDMGPSIIAHTMVEYKRDWGGAWHELLHEIIHGRQMGAHAYQKRALYDFWCLWFNEGEHDQLKPYYPSSIDLAIYGREFYGLDVDAAAEEDRLDIASGPIYRYISLK